MKESANAGGRIIRGQLTVDLGVHVPGNHRPREALFASQQLCVLPFERKRAYRIVAGAGGSETKEPG